MLDTDEIKAVLEGVDITSSEILTFLGQMVAENSEEIDRLHPET